MLEVCQYHPVWHVRRAKCFSIGTGCLEFLFILFYLGGRSHYVVPSALNSGYSFRLSITGCIRQGSLEEQN